MPFIARSTSLMKPSTRPNRLNGHITTSDRINTQNEITSRSNNSPTPRDIVQDVYGSTAMQQGAESNLALGGGIERRRVAESNPELNDNMVGELVGGAFDSIMSRRSDTEQSVETNRNLEGQAGRQELSQQYQGQNSESVEELEIGDERTSESVEEILREVGEILREMGELEIGDEELQGVMGEILREMRELEIGNGTSERDEETKAFEKQLSEFATDKLVGNLREIFPTRFDDSTWKGPKTDLDVEASWDIITKLCGQTRRRFAYLETHPNYKARYQELKAWIDKEFLEWKEQNGTTNEGS